MALWVHYTQFWGTLSPLSLNQLKLPTVLRSSKILPPQFINGEMSHIFWWGQFMYGLIISHHRGGLTAEWNKKSLKLQRPPEAGNCWPVYDIEQKKCYWKVNQANVVKGTIQTIPFCLLFQSYILCSWVGFLESWGNFSALFLLPGLFLSQGHPECQKSPACKHYTNTHPNN